MGFSLNALRSLALDGCVPVVIAGVLVTILLIAAMSLRIIVAGLTKLT